MKSKSENAVPLFFLNNRASSVFIRAVVLFFIILLLLFSVKPVLAVEKVTMAFGLDPAEEPQYQFYKNVYTEAFKDLGFEFYYIICPSKRCSEMANAGEVDGEPQRIAQYDETYPNMVRVDEPVFINRNMAFARNPAIRLDGVASLQGTNYRVEYLRGSVWSAQKLQSVVKPELLSEISTGLQALRRLGLNRTDVFVGLEASALRLLQEPEFRYSGIASAGVLGVNRSYPFLHKSHATLAPKLAAVLKEMKKDGRFYDILYRAMPYLPRRHIQ